MSELQTLRAMDCSMEPQREGEMMSSWDFSRPDGMSVTVARMRRFMESEEDATAWVCLPLHTEVGANTQVVMDEMVAFAEAEGESIPPLAWRHMVVALLAGSSDRLD